MQNEMCFASEIARRVHARAWLVLFESDEEAQLIDGTKQAVGEKTRGGEKKPSERESERSKKEDISADYNSRSNHRARILSRTHHGSEGERENT